MSRLFPDLSTDRLRLRSLKPTDAATVSILAGDKAIAETTLRIPHPYPEGVADSWIASLAVEFESNREIVWGVEETGRQRLIGCIGLMGIHPEFRHAELGYWIGKAFWGMGYATEAGRAVIDYAFQELDLLRVHAHHFTGNPASGRVLRKLGMSAEGRMRQHIVKNGRPIDIDLFGILRDDPRV